MTEKADIKPITDEVETINKKEVEEIAKLDVTDIKSINESEKGDKLTDEGFKISPVHSFVLMFAQQITLFLFLAMKKTVVLEMGNNQHIPNRVISEDNLHLYTKTKTFNKGVAEPSRSSFGSTLWFAHIGHSQCIPFHQLGFKETAIFLHNQQIYLDSNINHSILSNKLSKEMHKDKAVTIGMTLLILTAGVGIGFVASDLISPNEPPLVETRIYIDGEPAPTPTTPPTNGTTVINLD